MKPELHDRLLRFITMKNLLTDDDYDYVRDDSNIDFYDVYRVKKNGWLFFTFGFHNNEYRLTMYSSSLFTYLKDKGIDFNYKSYLAFGSFGEILDFIEKHLLD